MEKKEAIEIAKTLTLKSGWIWREPVSAIKKRKYFFGKAYWSITTNSECIGMNVRVLIDDSTGQIIRSSFSKR
jgi:hypothetical protein